MEGQAKTTEELYQLLKLGMEQSKPSVIDPLTLKYAIYVRKSTTDDERQETSLDDQLAGCIESVVKPHGLNVVATVPESQSAKEPDIREKFTKLLKDIRRGKIDGIIAWHPDRLSRNMREAGEIIDMLDKGELKDLRFATSHFENNPTGKMLLGMSFVLSKQYSEHLSESVNRGNRSYTERGEFLGELKHGYYINKDRHLYPDGENFILVQKAFKKRLQGESQPEIVKWLNSKNYTVRRRQKDPKPFKWDKDAISNVLKDPVYAGVLKYGQNLVNLAPLYGFEPMVTVEEFFKINKISNLNSSKLVASMVVKQNRDTKANVMRGSVVCGHCNKNLTSSITPKPLPTGETRWYYYYKCETKMCVFYGKSVRAKVIVDYAIQFLSTHLFTTKDNHKKYMENARGYIAAQSKDLTSEIGKLSKQIGDKGAEYERSKVAISANPALAEHFDLDKIKSERDAIQSDLDRALEKRASLKPALEKYEEYLELFENVGVILSETEDMEVLDKTLRQFISNFVITNKAVSVMNLKEPWAGFLKTNNFERGRGDRTRTYDLAVPNRAR